MGEIMMGMSIDEALEYLTDFSMYSPYQEAIDKVSAYIEQMQADYENRLKADMVAMLEEIKEKVKSVSATDLGEVFVRNSCRDVIQQKINEIKAEVEPQESEVSK